MDEDQAGPDPGESRVDFARPNSEPTYDEFMANVYPNVLESLKFLADKYSRLEWLKPIPEEDIPATTEPDWVISPNELPEPENNWANALASSYQDLKEYKLLRQTSDMSSFINWFCKRIGKKKLSKADLEGPTFMVV
ncbi:hypothetical protein Tco_0540091 [Tanacetum coccineum]